MPKVFFKAIKESVMASNASGKDLSRRDGTFDHARGAEPRSDDAWTQSSRSNGTAGSPSTESPVVGHALSVIGPSLVFKGKLAAQEDLLIQGRVEGSINHGGTNLTIGAHGEVKADIVARKVIIQGAVQGDIRASDAIVVEASARVQGNLFAPRIALKDGAKFQGTVDMEGGAAEAMVDELLESSGS
jgi:cytoskeletal protein CcmA (bactofilin family)